MTQCEQIMRHLEQYGSITSAEAESEYGIYRLASRISDLKKSGVRIKRTMINAKNRFDKPIHFAKYRLEE